MKIPWDTVGYYAMGVLITLTMFFITYIGFTIFLYCSLWCLLTPFTTGMSYITDSHGMGLYITHLVLWCIYSVPIISLLLSINWQLVSRFFLDYKVIFNFDRIVKYLKYQFGKPDGGEKRLIIVGLAVQSIICILIGLMIWLSSYDSFGWTSFLIGFISLITPVRGFIKVPLIAWKEILWPDDLFDEYELNEIDDEAKYVDDNENETEDEDKPGKPRHHISVLDPFNIRKQSHWVGVVRYNSKIFNNIRNKEWNNELIAPLVFGTITILYIIIDIVVLCNRVKNTVRFDESLKQIGNEFKKMQEELLIGGSRPGDTADIMADMARFGDSLVPDASRLVISTIIRLIATIFLFPFGVSANVVTVLGNWSKFKKQSRVRFSQLVSLVLMLLYFIVFSAWGIFVGEYEWKQFRSGYTTVDPLYAPISNGTRTVPVICNLRVDNWDYMELVAMPMLAQLKQTDQNAYNQVLSELYRDSTSYKYMPLKNSVLDQFTENEELNFDANNISVPMFVYMKNSIGGDGVSVNFQSVAYGFGGISGHGHIAFMIENVMKYWFDYLIGDVIPFFGMMRGIAMETFLTNIPNIVEDLFFGFETKTEMKLRNDIFWLGAAYDGEKYQADASKPVNAEIGSVVVGHSSGGLFAKVLGSKKDDMSVMAWESPVFENSPSYHLLFGSNIVDDVDLGWERLINVFSQSSLYTADEENATTNWKYPSLKTSMFSFVQPINAFETFCYHAAACARDDRYDRLCSWAVRPEVYQNYSLNWGYTRNPIDQRYLEGLPW